MNFGKATLDGENPALTQILAIATLWAPRVVQDLIRQVFLAIMAPPVWTLHGGPNSHKPRKRCTHEQRPGWMGECIHSKKQASGQQQLNHGFDKCSKILTAQALGVASQQDTFCGDEVRANGQLNNGTLSTRLLETGWRKGIRGCLFEAIYGMF